MNEYFAFGPGLSLLLALMSFVLAIVNLRRLRRALEQRRVASQRNEARREGEGPNS